MYILFSVYNGSLGDLLFQTLTILELDSIPESKKPKLKFGGCILMAFGMSFSLG